MAAAILNRFCASALVLATWIPAWAQPSCPASLASTSATIRDSGNFGIITVYAADTCSWSASTTESWLRFDTTVRTGFGEVRYQAEGNQASTTRSAVITIGPLSFRVTQEGRGQVTLLGGSWNFGSPGGTATLTVEPHVAGTPWTAASQVPWITILSGVMGTGIGQMTYSVAPYNGSTPRTGDLIIGGSRLTITQSGLNRGMRFVPVTPCRAADTREGTVMVGGSTRTFAIGQSNCGPLPQATAYSLNVTVVPRVALGYLTLWPSGLPRPLVSTVNSFDGRVKANAAIVPAGAGGAVDVFVTDTTDVILDLTGYFVPADGANTMSTLAFVSYNDCRLVDTRQTTPFGAGETRTYQFGPTGCSYIPSTAGAFALNITVIPRAGSLSYLTIWPGGTARPLVSTLNSPTGTVVANAAIVAPSANGTVSVFVTDPADVIIDMNGFFDVGVGLQSLSSGTHFYPLSPCRIADTRNAVGRLAGPEMKPSETREFPVPAASCGAPSSETGRFYVLNATVVPHGSLSYLTLSQSTLFRPPVSTLNAYDGSVTSNLAIVRGGPAGSIDAFVTDRTHLVLDISGYFAEP